MWYCTHLRVYTNLDKSFKTVARFKIKLNSWEKAIALSSFRSLVISLNYLEN